MLATRSTVGFFICLLARLEAKLFWHCNVSSALFIMLSKYYLKSEIVIRQERL